MAFSITLNKSRRFKTVLACALGLGLAACGHGGPAPIQSTPAPGGGQLVQVKQSGTRRVEFLRADGAGPWETLSMRNGGVTPLQNLNFWSQGRASLLQPPDGNFKPEDLFSPFSLMPGEDFALSAPAGTEQIFGILEWLSPRDPGELMGSFQHIKNAQVRSDGTIALTPGRTEAWVQFELSAPLTYNSVRIAWEAEPEPVTPQIWLNVEGDVWARIPQPRPRVDWVHPANLTSSIAGNRRFWLRLVYEIPEEGQSEAGAAIAPATLMIRRIRIDREVQGAGHLREWHKGANLFDVALQGRGKPKLEIRVNGKK